MDIQNQVNRYNELSEGKNAMEQELYNVLVTQNEEMVNYNENLQRTIDSIKDDVERHFRNEKGEAELSSTPWGPTYETPQSIGLK